MKSHYQSFNFSTSDVLITRDNDTNYEIIVSECNSFNRDHYPTVDDFSYQLPVSEGGIVTVTCEKPDKYALNSGDRTLTCDQG